MLATQNRFFHGATFIFALALFLSGCTPPGPRAALKGKKYIERGDYAAAVEQLKTATTLLATNAAVWNYYGVALQGAGQPKEAADAYQRALSLNRDLMEARYNLGTLWLDLNKPDAAKTEFTAYTMRRANAPEGWLKLGAAQLRLREVTAAEKSFATALTLSTNNAEAFNGLGLARMQRGQPREAAQFFSAAVQYHPDYAPAWLNLATVAQQNLRDNKLALQSYRAYLALSPKPANWDEVNAIVKNLEQPMTVAAAAPPQTVSQPTPAPAVTKPAPQPEPKETKSTPVPEAKETKPQPVVRPATSPKAQSSARVNSNPPPHTAVTPEPQPEVVKVTPEPTVMATPAPEVATPAQPPVESTPAQVKSGGSKLNPLNWFRSSPSDNEKYADSRITPLPATSTGANNHETLTTPVATASTNVKPPPSTPDVIPDVNPAPKPPPPVFPRYGYISPSKPKAGDRVAASAPFTQARTFEQESRWADALKNYQQAATLDPGWFEAQYNTAVVATRTRNFSVALPAYERALTLQPDAADARYYFAQTLKSAGYAEDAVNELKKIVANDSNDVRAHLALGGLYAQQLRDPAKARVHYLKVLALDPNNAQANDIRFWLASNPS